MLKLYLDSMNKITLNGIFAASKGSLNCDFLHNIILYIIILYIYFFVDST